MGYILLLLILVVSAEAEEYRKITLDTIKSVTVKDVTVSGWSSGGVLSQALLYSHSNVIKGALSMCGNVYGCPGCLRNFNENDKKKVLEDIAIRERGRFIEPLEGLKRTKYMNVICGNYDLIYTKQVQESSRIIFSEFGATVKEHYQSNSAHVWMNDRHGNPCFLMMPMFVSNCGYNIGHEMFSFFYGDLKNRTEQVNVKNFFQFEQQKYTPRNIKPGDINMHEKGVVYVPTACQGNTRNCKLHVWIHTCSQGYYNPLSPNGAVELTSLTEYAETNNIVILHPGSGISWSNGIGCWNCTVQGQIPDKRSPIIQTIKKMIDTILNV